MRVTRIAAWHGRIGRSPIALPLKKRDMASARLSCLFS